MKKFTLISLLMLICCVMAKAEIMDKYFFKIPTDKMADGWIVQDAGNFVGTPGKDYFEAKNNKNGGRMLNYFWNEEAWTKVKDLSTLPNSEYKFTMDLNVSNMAARADMEFTLLPVNACESGDSRISTHNQRWWNSAEGEDYFFRWRVGEAPAAANGDFTIWINENPTGKTDWTQTTEETLVLSSQKTYKFACVINTTAKTATYTISDEEGNQLATGVHNYVCAEDRAGIFIFSMNGTSTHQLSNIGLSYEAEGPFASEPSCDPLAVIGTQRAYYVNFKEGEVLHWVQLGNADDAVNGASYASGEEYTATYWESNDTRDFEANADEYFGSKIIYCTESGDLRVWTTMEDDESNISDEVVTPVVCEAVTMPVPVATITNVQEGYAKEYTITADNSNTLLKPVVTINCVVKDASGNTIETKNLMSGEKVTLTSAGSIELYSYDGTHPDPWYSPSEAITVNNNVEYVEQSFTNYAWTKEECDATKAGYTVTEIVDNANKSHWDRIYSNQKYGYDEAGNAAAWVDGTEYVWVKEGFGFYEGSAIGTDDAKWNVQVPEDIYTGFKPLVPAEADNYTAGAWAIFPLEGIVYYAINIANLSVGISPEYVSDDASKPNFFIVHTRGGYDRPDKGDCNATTVCVAGENYSLFRYDTAICDVRIMTYKGFELGSGISSTTIDNAAPAIRKVITDNGIVIVKGDKTFSVSGAQMK
ncbi:MAG: hypothetical protein ACI3YT_09660 [Prevotella sp.]